MDFKLVSNYKPQGDQAQAIEALTRGVFDREQHQVLLGVTGSGKTFTVAKVIEAANRRAGHGPQQNPGRPALPRIQEFLSAQRRRVFRLLLRLLPARSLCPAADLYIEKESTINDELDKLRLSATRSLFERRDCLIVA